MSQACVLREMEERAYLPTLTPSTEMSKNVLGLGAMAKQEFGAEVGRRSSRSARGSLSPFELRLYHFQNSWGLMGLQKVVELQEVQELGARQQQVPKITTKVRPLLFWLPLGC